MVISEKKILGNNLLDQKREDRNLEVPIIFPILYLSGRKTTAVI